MLFEVASANIKWEILGITFLMMLLSQLFRKKFSVSREGQMELQTKTKEIQDELKLAQAQGDQQKVAKLYAEMTSLMKDMMKNQLLPMIIRSVVFLGIFGLLRMFYGKYDNIIGGLNWWWTYFIFSLTLSIVVGLIRKQIKSKRPETESDVEGRDHVRALSNNFAITTGSNPVLDFDEPAEDNNDSVESNKAWKQKILDDD